MRNNSAQGTLCWCCAEKSADCLFVGWTEHKQWQIIQCLSSAPECSSHQAPVQQLLQYKCVLATLHYTTERQSAWAWPLERKKKSTERYIAVKKMTCLTVHLVRCLCCFILWRKRDKAKPFWLARRWMAYNLHCRAYARIIQITIRVYEVIRIATWNNSTMLRESVLESCFISIVRKTCTLIWYKKRKAAISNLLLLDAGRRLSD